MVTLFSLISTNNIPSHKISAEEVVDRTKEQEMQVKRHLRIGNVSGATGDHPQAMLRMAEYGNVDVIVGDWLSEMNIAWNAIAKLENPQTGFEPGFLCQLEDSIDIIAEKRIKVITNAGALNTLSLMKKVLELCQNKGLEAHKLKIAAVLGDDISELVIDAKKSNGVGLHHLDHDDWRFQDWPFQPHCAVAYIGAWGIVEALNAGADIILCGRVTDASPVIGAAAWWHQWPRDAWDQLASGLLAGRKFSVTSLNLCIKV